MIPSERVGLPVDISLNSELPYSLTCFFFEIMFVFGLAYYAFVFFNYSLALLGKHLKNTA